MRLENRPSFHRRWDLLPWFVAANLTIPALAAAMQIQWTRMAGRWPVEASPLVIASTNSATDQILILNRGGQLLLWSADGAALGPGQDGLIAQLPEGRWTTTPTLVNVPSGARFVVASVEGQVLGLDRNFQILWQHKLPGETVWGCALPAILHATSDPALVFTDSSGTLTCLTVDGVVAWTNRLAAGPSKAPAQTFSAKPNEDLILAPAGATLFCCRGDGSIRWRHELAGTDAGAPGSHEILTRPEVLSAGDRSLILCGTAAGKLCALDLDDKLLWECVTEDALSRSISVLPRRGSTPLILFTGLWGNLHAVDVRGRNVWTHLFRAKVRGKPLVLDADGDGHPQIFVPTFHQHVYQFDENGQLKDDIRLSGIMPSALTRRNES